VITSETDGIRIAKGAFRERVIILEAGGGRADRVILPGLVAISGADGVRTGRGTCMARATILEGAGVKTGRETTRVQVKTLVMAGGGIVRETIMGLVRILGRGGMISLSSAEYDLLIYGLRPLGG
jgi:hypothetical protein